MEEQDLLKPTQIIRSKRKSISLIIKHNGDFIIRAPINAKDADIIKFVSQKAEWIISKRKEQLNNKLTPLSFNSDDKLTILGQMYNITYLNVARTKVVNNQIFVPKEKSKEKLITFLKRFAKNYLDDRVLHIASLFDFKYASVSISSAKSCWGSCGPRNRLHFTYKLMLCTEDVVDYVIIHELCHTKVKNHSAKFWDLVRSCCPNYKMFEKWLKKNRAIVELI